MLSLCELSTASSMAHRVDGVLVGYPIATPSLRISTRVPRDQKGAWPKLTRACVPRTDGTVNGARSPYLLTIYLLMLDYRSSARPSRKIN